MSMKVKFFTIPVNDLEKQTRELNSFLTGNKIVEFEKQLVESNKNYVWCISIIYIEEFVPGGTISNSVDYKKELSESEWENFEKLRQFRRDIAKDESLPAYSVFLDKELAEISKLEEISIEKMKKIKGIGIKKVEKYGERIIQMLSGSASTEKVSAKQKKA